MKRRLGFLCGGPRISTRPDTKAAGPRAHILGAMKAYEKLGWEVMPFIVGDKVPRRWANLGSEQLVRGTERPVRGRFLLALAADLILSVVSFATARWARVELDGRVDCVYERFYPFNSMGRVFRQRGVPWILETNAPVFYEVKTKKHNIVLSSLASRAEIRAYKECDVLVCVSETLKEITVREAGIPPAKVLVVPNAVDTEFFNPETCRPERIFEGFTVGYVGSLEPRQGLGLLIEALSDLRAEGSEISVVVVGDGTMRAAWEALASRLGLSEHVAFVGRVRQREVPRYIAGFDLGYYGQVRMREGEMYYSPLKLYEYMAMAKPVVASDFEAARRVIQNEETGFLFQPSNKEDLKHALTRAYGSQNRLLEMGNKAREEVVCKHNWLVRTRDIISAVEARVGSPDDICRSIRKQAM